MCHRWAKARALHQVRGTFCCLATALACLLGGLALPAWAQGRPSVRVEMELATEPGFSPLETQNWYRLLTGLGVRRLRIGGLGPAAKLSVERLRLGGTTVVRVRGRLTARNRLVVPGGSFSLGDARRIRRWLEQLQQPPRRQDSAPRGPFGLSATELARLRQLLSPAVPQPTQGRSRGEVFTQLERLCPVPLQAPPGLAAILDREGGPVQVELKGLALGTSLACVLRPAGYVLVVRKNGPSFRLAAVPARAAEEIWPVGFRVSKLQGKRFERLFVPVPVNVAQGTRVTQVLPAFAKGLKMPILVDHLGLAAAGLELEQLRTFHPPKRRAYLFALESLLGRAGLVVQVREDEAGRVFLWVTAARLRR